MRTLLSALNHIRGVVDVAGLLPMTSHVLLAEDVLTATNGRVALTIVLARGEDTRVRAAVPYAPLRAALQACADRDWPQPIMAMVNEHLTITGKQINVRLPTIPEDKFLRLGFDKDQPTHKAIMLPRKDAKLTLDDAFKLLAPFTAVDATRPWSNAILHRKGYLYATNNVAAIRVAAPFVLPYEFKVPAEGALEVAKLGHPSALFCSDSGVGFDYSSSALNAEVYTLQHAGEWPDVERLFEGIGTKLPRVPEGLKDAVATVASIDDSLTNSVALEAKGSALTIKSGAESDGGNYVEVKLKLTTKATYSGRYGVKVLQQVLAVASHMDLARFPNPIPFRNEDGLEGVFVGLR